MSQRATWFGWFLAPLMFAAMIILHGASASSYLMGDFRAFYCAGAAIAQGANPYLEEPLRSCESETGPPREPLVLRSVALPAPLPPHALMLFVPLALLPFPLAAAIYGVLLMVAMAFCVAAYARITGAPTLLLNVIFAGITATVTLYVGQPVPFVLLALAATALHLREQRWIAASACAVAASIEPHLALPVLVAMFVVFAPTRAPLVLLGLCTVGAGVLALGLPITLTYVREVVPAHALANAFEWQFSLTSLLTSLGLAAAPAIRAGEVMFALMTAIGTWVAWRLMRREGDRALIAIVPPAFAVFGGVHVHFQQIAVAFPAIVYVAVRYPRLRVAAACALGATMIPWNVMGSSAIFAGLAPAIVGVLGAMVLTRRAGLAMSITAAAIVFSLLALATLGFGPAEAHFVARVYPPGALAETSWGDFSREALMRPSILMHWLRIPTLGGLACGLIAIAWSARAPRGALACA